MDTDRPNEPPDLGKAATPEPPPPPSQAPPTPATPPTPSEASPASPQAPPPEPPEPPHVPVPPVPPSAVASSEPAFHLSTDWPALATMASAIIAVGMMFPEWTIAKFLGQESTENGFDRELVPAGPVLLVILLVAVVAVAGYALLAKRPHLLVFAAIPGFGALMVLIVTMTTLSKIGGDLLGSIPGGSYSLGVGAWLCLVFTIAALCLSLFPLVDVLRRPPAPPARPPEFPHAEGD